jgi:hypothetical protein
MAVISPGMTSPDPVDTHPTAFDDSVFENCFFHVLAAGRGESTARWKKRRYDILIYQDWKYGYLSQVGFNHELYLFVG